MKFTKADFSADTTGRRFADVVNDTRIKFDIVVAFLDDADKQKRMCDAEIHHDRAALAGVVAELETNQDVDDFFSMHDAHTTGRFRQAVGVAVKVVMEKLGWSKRGFKGSLGRRKKVQPGTTTPGAYYNESGLSVWFTQAERFEPPKNHPERKVWENRQSVLETRRREKEEGLDIVF